MVTANGHQYDGQEQGEGVMVEKGVKVETGAGEFGAILAGEIARAGGELLPAPGMEGAIGTTMFDVPGSEDGSVTVVLPDNNIARAPSQALLRIASLDGRRYLGMVTSGPFVEPDSLRGDSPMLTAVAVRGGQFRPPYHGRVQVTILGEEIIEEGDEPDLITLGPPRLRPLPGSPVFPLSEDEAAQVFHARGDIRLGLSVGYEGLEIGVPSTDKAVLPRHVAILGSTGSGKSTTVSNFSTQAQKANMAVVVLDVEGEYVAMHEPTEDRQMVSRLKKRGLPHTALPEDDTSVYCLAGRETANPEHPHLRRFSLSFERLSPYTVVEIAGMNEPQAERYWYAYSIAKTLMREVGIFPTKGGSADLLKEQEAEIQRLDEFDRAYPKLTLSFMIDVVEACLAQVNKTPFTPFDLRLASADGEAAINTHIKGRAKEIPGNAASWGKVRSLLWRLKRGGVFDRPARDGAPALDYSTLITPSHVSLFDLSDAGMTELSNLVIADTLRGIQEAQDAAYRAYEEDKKTNPQAPLPPRVVVIIEEAHEFLAAERIEKMDVLFRQVATIAKRGRKRWMSLVFVTQLPQHLPRQVLGLVNGFVLHKITDPLVISSLQRMIPGIDESLWRRLPALAPGQAIVSFPHMAQPLLVAMDPTPVKLRMID
jgi:DNA helicase HerA-like ATPase